MEEYLNEEEQKEHKSNDNQDIETSKQQPTEDKLAKRDPYSFGLGKRGGDETVYSFGMGRKRDPYGFGLGKRDPYSFGLGKRDPYSFGLGKRSEGDHISNFDGEDPYAFGFGKRDPYSFGLGKRDPYSFGLGK